ncbi:MAG: DUF3488 and transglutaminase-like domain-containing protein [Cellvibrionaceae bacterium]
MKFNSATVIFWYSLTQGVSAAAVSFAYLGIMTSLALGLFFSIGSFISLSMTSKVDEEGNPYLRLSEQIASAGLVSFILLILLTGLLPALLIFSGFALFALNFQTHDYRRYYVGTAITFSGIAVGSAESKTGSYLVFFLLYASVISFSLGYAFIEQRKNDSSKINWNRHDRLRANLLLIGLAVLIYLLLPRFPAGNLGAQPNSEHFYINEAWEDEAEKNTDVESATNKAEEHLQNTANTDEAEDESHSNTNSDSIPEGENTISENSRPTEDTDHSNTKNSSDQFNYKGFDTSFDINNPDPQNDRFENIIIARMRADTPMYLRARIFDRFDGIRWSSSAEQLQKIKNQRGGITLKDHPLPEGATLESYEIIVESHLGDYIAAAAVPMSIHFPGSVVGVDGFGQLFSPAPLRSGTHYAAKSMRWVSHGRSFAETDFVDLPGYHQIPDDFDPRITELASKITSQVNSDLEKAIRLEQHLRSEYKYDLNSVFTSQNQTPLSKFLFESKKGHCEYFASALAMMLRTQGIPARLVTGFSATNQNPLTGYYDIYALDGHAWVEAWVDDIGWVELEPTGYYDGPMPEKKQALSAEQINEYVERIQRLQEVLGESDEISLTGILGSLWQSFYLLVSWIGGYIKLLIITGWKWILTLIALGGILRISWIHYRPRWEAKRICQQIRANSKNKEPHLLPEIYLSGIAALIANTGYKHPPGWTMERLALQLKNSLQTDVPTEISLIFNQINYGEFSQDQLLDPDSNYKALFDYVAGLEYSTLKARLLEQNS